MLALGMIGIFSSFYSYFGLHKDKDYSPITGKIRSVEEYTVRKYGGKLYYAKAWKINFSYTIDTVNYTGVEHIEAWDIFSSTCPYAANNLVTAYYNPQAPSEAVLVRNVPLALGELFGHLVIYLLFTACGSMILFKPEFFLGSSKINSKSWYAQRAPEQKIAFWVSEVMIPTGIV
jgi:hypothetical protein